MVAAHGALRKREALESFVMRLMRLNFGAVVVFSGGDALCPCAFRNVPYHSDTYESTPALRGSEAYMNHKLKHRGKAKIALVALCSAVFCGCAYGVCGLFGEYGGQNRRYV